MARSDAQLCFLNGRYVDVRRAVVPATDRGLLYGDGLFETWRTYKGRPFAVAEHLARLTRSARVLGIPFDRSEDWTERSRELVRRNGLEKSGCVLRLTITRGPAPLQLVPPAASKPTRLMLVRPLEAGLRGARENGVAVHLFDVEHGARAGLSIHKTLNYLVAVTGKSQAAARGCFEAVYRAPDSSLLEGATSNLFIVKSNRFITPSVAAGVLPGVTRAIVMRLARALGRVEQRSVTDRDLIDADEAFLTSTSIEIVPIVRVGRRIAAGGRRGPLTRELQQRYRRHVARKLGMDVTDLGE